MNEKEEFLKVLDTDKVKCANIYIYTINTKGNILQTRHFVLKINYSRKEYVEFLEMLNFEYIPRDNEFHISGTVWLDNETWIERISQYNTKLNRYTENWLWKYKPEISDCCYNR